MAKNPEKKSSEPNDSPKIIKDTIKKPRLLVIAEDDDIRQSAVLAGGKENFAVRAVDNGSDALNLLINTEFSKSQGINVLSLARFFLFGARDVWFIVCL